MSVHASESGFIPETSREVKTESIDFEFLKNPGLRKEIKKRTENLVSQVNEGNIDVVFFLDKSARPISWLFQDLWKQKFPEKRLPAIRYINVGSGHIVREKGLSEMAHVYLSNSVKDLKDIFGKQFQSKTILVVDEIGASGISEFTACQLIKDSFPEAEKVDSTHLFSAEKDRELLAETHGRLPWGDYVALGVGIFDLDTEILVRLITPESAKRKADEIMQKIVKEVGHYYDDEMWKMILQFSDDIKKKIDKLLELDLNSFKNNEQTESVHHVLNRLVACLELMKQASLLKDKVFCFMEMGQIALEVVSLQNKGILKKELFDLFSSIGLSKFIGTPITNPWNGEKFYYFYNLSQSPEKCRALRETSLQLRKEMKAIATEKSE